jgi:acid phosphatase family membrane protein YuiD
MTGLVAVRFARLKVKPRGAGLQVLNQIIVSLPEAHPVQENGRPVLRDTLGHTPAQVCAGAAVGLVVAILGHDSGTWRTVYD